MFRTRPITSNGPPAVILMLAALALLAACGSHPAARAPSTADGMPQVSVSAFAPTEGPVSAGHTWPDGLSVKVTDMRRMDSKLGWQLAADRTLVKVTLTFANAGTAPVPLTSGMFLWHLLSGPNRLAVPDDEGDQFTGPQLTSPVPERVTPGNPVTVFNSYDVPTADLATLAVRVDLGDREPFTFTDVQTLLKA